jgi:DNA-binding GntR family transcriptional regulator
VTAAVPPSRPPARPLQADIVRDGLRRAILSGEFQPRAALPNEGQLGSRFAVSRATIREAVRGLVEEGYLVRRQGSGTYVTERPLLRNSLDVNFSYTAYLESLGVRATRRVLGVRRGPAGEAVADRLRVTPNHPVVEVRRVRTADDRPAIFSIDVMPADIAGSAADDAFGGSLYSFLAAVGHPVAHGEAILSPAAADETLATVLGVPAGTLLQHVEQVDVDLDGRRVMLSREWHVPAVIELRCFRRGPGISTTHEADT